MPGNLTVGIDVGTTGVKASVLNTDNGQVIAQGMQEHPLFHPKPGYAEQDPDNYWKAVVDAVRQCLSQGDFADRISGVSLSGLVGVMLPVSKNGKPIRPAMIWMDARSEAECQEIRERVGEDAINDNNGNRVAPWFVEPKALWMKKHEPENFDNTACLLSPSGYCTYKMCGELTANTGDAGLFYPYEYQKERWNGDIAAKIGVPLEKYPKIYQSHEVVGQVTAEASEQTGLPKGAHVVAGGTDISAAALGAGVTNAGQAFYSMGTGSNIGIMIPTEQRVEEYRILKWPSVQPGLTMFDAPMAFTGASLKWFRDQFADPENLIADRAGINVFDLIAGQAANTDPGAGGLMYFPYLGTSLAPNWNSDAVGMFFGVRPTSSRAHFIRALIEGVAFDLNSNVNIARRAGVTINKLTLNGGPTKSRLWNQITANVTNIPLEVPDVGEAAPFGDAILAAVGAGLYPDPVSPLRDLVSVKETIEPDLKKHEMYAEMFTLWRQIYKHVEADMADHREILHRYEFS